MLIALATIHPGVFLVIAFLVLFVLAVALRKPSQAEQDYQEKVGKTRTQLDTEVKEAFLLVATRDPGNEKLRDLVLDAARCLVLEYSSVNSRRIIGLSDYLDRYKQGLEKTAEVRKQLGV